MLFSRLIPLLLFVGVSLHADKQLQSASELDYPPFSIVKEKNIADGFSVDILKASLKAMGYGVDFYVAPWDTIRKDLKTGKIDVLPLVGRTPEREAYFDFSFPYLTMHGAIFVRKGNTDIKSLVDLKDKNVLVMKGDNAEEFVRREHVSKHIVTTENYTEAFRLLASGKYDAVISQKLIGLNILKTENLENIQTVGKRLENFKQSFSFAVKEGDKELLAVLNEGLALVMQDGTFLTLQEKWFAGLHPDKTTSRYLYPLSIAVLILVAILLVVLTWQRTLQRLVAKRTHELEESKEKLKVSGDLFYMLFKNMHSGSVIYSPYRNGEDFIIDDINLRGEQISSVKKEEILGEKVTKIFPAVKDLGLFDIFQEVYRTGEPKSQDTSLYEDGRIAIWVENFVYKLPSGKIIANYSDRTQEKIAQSQLESLNKDLEKRVNAAIEKTKRQEKMLLQQSRFTAIGEMIGAIAHQWRQPLNSVGLMVQDIRDAYEYNELDKAYIDETISNTMNQINYLSKTIDDFRTFFLPNTEKEDFHACDIIHKATALLNTQFRNHHIRIEYRCEDDFILNGYPNEFKQAIINILSNAKDAIMHSDNSKNGWIEIQSYMDGKTRTLSIKNNGGRIPDEIAEKIYDPYFTTKFSSLGTGIGLYMTKSIIEQNMGGTLSFLNTDEGVCFRISFPEAEQ